MTVWRRVRQMPLDEVVFRVRGMARTQVQRLRIRLAGTRWDRNALVHLLEPRLLDGPMRTAIAQHEWSTVERRLRHTMRARPARYPIDPSEAGWVREQIATRYRNAPRDAAASAEKILANRYDLLGYEGLSFESGNLAVDWHRDPVHGRRAPVRFWADVRFLDPACGDHKVIWEVNRHQHFLRLGRALWLTGDARYGRRIVDEVESWLAANPPLQGINWASMLELAFRSLSWVAAIHLLLGAGDAMDGDAPDSRPWLLDMLLGIDRQLEHVAQHLSLYFSPNTHLTGEALALYTAGAALPELARSARWMALGRSILLREAGRQIARDGGHIERSTHYHRYTLDFYTLAWLVARHAHDADAAAVFGDAVGRLARAARAWADGNGRIPLVGDDDGGMLWPIAGRDSSDLRDSLAVAALLLEQPDLAPWPLPEEAFWIAGRAAASGEARTGTPVRRQDRGFSPEVFPDTGFVSVSTAEGDHLVFDAGPHGFRNGGHAHADALALTLSLSGRPLLIDPGTATYTMDRALRDRMRSSQMHNTLTLDGRSSAVPGGPFRWQIAANACLDRSRGNRGFLWLQGSHDGYAPAVHRRSIIGSGAGWLLRDEVESRQEHLAELFWHFDPAWRVTQVRPGVLRAVAEDTAAWLLSNADALTLTHGDPGGLGWCSPRYGSLVPAWTARCASRVATGRPLVTWIGTATTEPHLEHVRADGFSCVRVRRGDERSATVMRQGSSDATIATAEYRTDAGLLQWSWRPGRMTLSLADAVQAAAVDEGLLGAAADAKISDLHAVIAHGRIELTCSSPPPRLQLSGRALAAAEVLLLNGREHRIERRGHDLIVAGPDWREPGSASRASRPPASAVDPDTGRPAALPVRIG